jgi:septum formation protein
VEEPELTSQGLEPAQQAEALAYFKARSVWELHKPDLPVLGADTVVSSGLRVFGKPRHRGDAREILSALAGTRHQVITGVALIDVDGARLIASEVTHVRMRAMSYREMESYLDSGQWQGKAGAYGIQDHEDAFVQCIEGSFTNVVGLPMELLKGLLAQLVMRHGQ